MTVPKLLQPESDSDAALGSESDTGMVFGFDLENNSNNWTRLRNSNSLLLFSDEISISNRLVGYRTAMLNTDTCLGVIALIQGTCNNKEDLGQITVRVNDKGKRSTARGYWSLCVTSWGKQNRPCVGSSRYDESGRIYIDRRPRTPKNRRKQQKTGVAFSVEKGSNSHQADSFTCCEPYGNGDLVSALIDGNQVHFFKNEIYQATINPFCERPWCFALEFFHDASAATIVSNYFPKRNIRLLSKEANIQRTRKGSDNEVAREHRNQTDLSQPEPENSTFCGFSFKEFDPKVKRILSGISGRALGSNKSNKSNPTSTTTGFIFPTDPEDSFWKSTFCWSSNSERKEYPNKGSFGFQTDADFNQKLTKNEFFDILRPKITHKGIGFCESEVEPENTISKKYKVDSMSSPEKMRESNPKYSIHKVSNRLVEQEFYFPSKSHYMRSFDSQMERQLTGIVISSVKGIPFLYNDQKVLFRLLPSGANFETPIPLRATCNVQGVDFLVDREQHRPVWINLEEHLKFCRRLNDFEQPELEVLVSTANEIIGSGWVELTVDGNKSKQIKEVPIKLHSQFSFLDSASGNSPLTIGVTYSNKLD